MSTLALAISDNFNAIAIVTSTALATVITLALAIVTTLALAIVMTLALVIVNLVLAMVQFSTSDSESSTTDAAI